MNFEISVTLYWYVLWLICLKRSRSQYHNQHKYWKGGIAVVNVVFWVWFCFLFSEYSDLEPASWECFSHLHSKLTYFGYAKISSIGKKKKKKKLNQGYSVVEWLFLSGLTVSLFAWKSSKLCIAAFSMDVHILRHLHEAKTWVNL